MENKIFAKNADISIGLTAENCNLNCDMDGVQRNDNGYGLYSDDWFKKRTIRLGMHLENSSLTSPINFDAGEILSKITTEFKKENSIIDKDLSGIAGLIYSDICTDGITDMKDLNIKEYLINKYGDVSPFGCLPTFKKEKESSIQGCMTFDPFSKSFHKIYKTVPSTIVTNVPSKLITSKKATDGVVTEEENEFSNIGNSQVTRFHFVNVKGHVCNKIAKENQYTEESCLKNLFYHLLIGCGNSSSATRPLIEVTHIIKINYFGNYTYNSILRCVKFKSSIEDEKLSNIDDCRLDISRFKQLNGFQHFDSIDYWVNPILEVSNDIEEQLLSIFPHEKLNKFDFNTGNFINQK